MAQPRHDIEIPRIQFVATDSLVLHEQHDLSRTAPLAERIRRDGVLKNPPIVAHINGDERYVVLDGANRTTGLLGMHVPHVVVQMVNYDDPELVLDTWYHLVTEIEYEDFVSAMDRLTGIEFEPRDLLYARAALARRSAMAYLVYTDGRVLVARGDDELHTRAQALNCLVDAYRYRARIYRVNTDQIEQVRLLYQDVAALVVFPRYEPSEIIELARTGARLPAGITRHIIPRRALRLNIPLAKLVEDKSLEEKNEWLQGWLRYKLANREIRFYEESTWLFDE
jgi:hypothetical protein